MEHFKKVAICLTFVILISAPAFASPVEYLWMEREQPPEILIPEADEPEFIAPEPESSPQPVEQPETQPESQPETASLAEAPAQDLLATGYHIGPGDKLEISVWNHPELSKELRVRPDGMISFPIAGEVKAAGVAPEALRQEMTTRLRSNLRNPQVTVIVLEYKSKKVLVLGAVKTPGLYQYEGGMTTFDAVALSGGYNRHAELQNVLVVREPYEPRPEFHVVNLHKVIKEGDRSTNIVLQPQDIVYVPQNFIGNFADFFDYFAARIRPAADTYFLYEIAKDE